MRGKVDEWNKGTNKRRYDTVAHEKNVSLTMRSKYFKSHDRQLTRS